MKSKFLIILLIIIFLLLFILSMWIVNNKKEGTMLVNSSLSLSNKKVGWGTKREKNHEQPDLGKNNVKLISENNGITMGNPDKKYIYLTFDEGHEGGYTSKLLDVLKENNVKAAFFITGHYFNSQPDLIKRMIDEGHIIGNHTVNHHSMPSLSDEKLREEIIKLHTSVKEKFGYEMKYLRPPMGEFSERTLAYTKDLEYTTVMWSFAYDDWDVNKQEREEYAKNMILDNLHNGELMLLHAISKDNSNILDEIIKKIKEQGYEFKSLDEFEKL